VTFIHRLLVTQRRIPEQAGGQIAGATVRCSTLRRRNFDGDALAYLPKLTMPVTYRTRTLIGALVPFALRESVTVRVTM
jgi:hypothetical protein